MGDPGLDNVELLISDAPVDRVNARFYRRFQYPWAPLIVTRLADPRFERRMLAQAVGSWGRSVLPEAAAIWVAGCGTNQAVLTALRFPAARVLGTDLSEASLGASAELAVTLGVSNLELREENLNEATHRDEFDYVVCTGVVHHNRSPADTLARVAAGLRREGVLEVMVYNRYHCVEATAVQRAVRLLAGPAAASGDFDRQLDRQLDLAARLLREHEDLRERVQSFFPGVAHSETAVADAVIQPVEHTFTVRELAELLRVCGLEPALPCVNDLDVAREAIDWHLAPADGELAAAYEALDEVTRWQVANLVLLDASPMLWFYARRADARHRPGEGAVLEELAASAFEPARTRRETLLRRPDGSYRSAGSAEHPGRHPDESCRRVLDAAERLGPVPFRDVLAAAGLRADLATLRWVRPRLTTPAFPYLGCADGGGPADGGGR